MDGVLVIDKPAGPTSHDVVAKIRRALKEKKVGHTGTLDPVATGVLPLVLGKATKVAQYLTGSDKVYHAVVQLGVTTATLDGAGEVIDERPVEVTEEQVHKALAAFRGDIDQIPPMYSAKKVDGKRLYQLARKGIEVERESKQVTVHHLELLEWAPTTLSLRVECTAGTYVRVLARDIGERLGCGAHLKRLRRVAAGPFRIDDAIPLDEALQDPDAARERVLPVRQALADIPRIHTPPHLGRRIVDGYQLTVGDLKTLDVPAFQCDDVLTLATDAGEVIAIVRALFGADEIPASRRDRRAFKTERVLKTR